MASSSPRVARGTPALVSGRPWASRGVIVCGDELDGLADVAAVVVAGVRVGVYSVSASALSEGRLRLSLDDVAELGMEVDAGLEPDWIGAGGPMVPGLGGAMSSLPGCGFLGLDLSS